MSVQTTVLENGRWVTRNVDLYHVRAQNTETPRKEQDQPSISLPKTPSLGILTKTLVRSSVINRIIPAKIRHETKNDVLFISANFVTIKEAKGDYTLEEITTKRDFDSTIKCARIIGERRKLTKHDYNYTFFKEEDDWQPINTSEDDDFVEGDIQNPPALNRRELPPHILVLALESNRLVFLCAVSGSAEPPELLSSQKALPAPTSPLQGLGALMAVDPNSRAMAVAAHEKRVYIYTLKSMNEMRAEFKEASRLEPIKEEKLISLDVSILKMEFLHPPEDEPNRIILLLVVAGKSSNRLIWYDWSSDMPLHQARMRPNKIPLHPDEQLPLLLIPLEKYTAFILVCEKRIVLIKDILTGSFNRFYHHLAYEQDPQEPGISPRRPIWVQWARLMRSKNTWPNREYLVLCREDGIVQYMVIDPSIKQMIDSNHNVGKLGVNINTSFATVDLGPSTDDLLVTGGDESDGGLWDFPPRQQNPQKRGVLPDWTPVNDFAVAHVPIYRQNAEIAAAANTASKRQQRLFACSGRGKHGAVSELRYGVEASEKIGTADLSEDLEDGDLPISKGVLGMWALHGSYEQIGEQRGKDKLLEDVTYIILSHPQRTYLLQLRVEQNQDPNSDDAGLLKVGARIIGVDVGLDLSSRTIATARTDRGLTLQITETSLRVTKLPTPLMPILPDDDGIKAEDTEPDKSQLDAERSKERYTYQFGQSRILAACVHTVKDTTTVILAAQLNGQFYVEFGKISTEYQPLDQRIPLQSQSSCLSLLTIENETLVLVATLAKELEVYLLRDIISGMLSPATIIHHAFAGPFGICDSIATITRNTRKGLQWLLICGLRDGTVEILNLSKGVNTYQLHLSEKIAFGHTSVTVIKDATTDRVIIHCENTICTLQYPQNDDEAPAIVLNVWITDPNPSSLPQGEISVVSQVVDSWLPGGSPGFTAESFVCLEGDHIHVRSLDSQPKMVPRRLKFGGSPVRVLYSPKLNKLIVLHNELEVRRAAGRPNVPGTRALLPLVSFLDSDVDPVTGSGPNDDNHTLTKSECRPSEKFLGITEWLPEVGGKPPYHLLVVNTKLTRANKTAGRLLFFAITEGSGNQAPKLVIKKRIDTDEPVHSVATYLDTSLVYCSGNHLYMLTLGVADQSRIHWRNTVNIPIRSPASHISVKEPYIYVSSTRESLSVYRYDAGQFVYQFGDQYARSGLHHVQLPSQSLILASDTAGTVVGLWQPPERRLDNAMTTVFEAVLPGSITRLRRISRPIWSNGDHECHKTNLDKLTGPSSLEDETTIGSSADGTLTQLSILTSSEWRLLRFIQNMAERNPLICPFHPGNPHRRQIEPSTARPHYMHVNGDILERLLERGAESLLNDMLDVEPDLESHTDFGSKEDRRERFEELAKDVLKDVEGGELLGRVVLWLRYQLRNAL